MFVSFALLFVMGLEATGKTNTSAPQVAAGWDGLQAQWPRAIDFTSSKVTERSVGRRSCVLTGNDRDGPIQAIVVERSGFLAATLVDGSGIRWGARGVAGKPLQFEILPPEAMQDCAGAVEAPKELLENGLNVQAEGGIAGGCIDAPTVDVLVITTPAAREQAGGVGPLAALVDLAETSANAAYSNSDISPRIRVVFDTEIPYTEVSFGTDLNTLASGGDGILDEIHQLRDAAGADLVAMIRSNGEYCGIAYLMPANDPSVSGIGFSVTAWSCLSSQTFAHELGHNMGCCHAPNDGGGCTTGGLFPQSVGHRFNGSSGTQYRTVMAYSPGARIDNFSNPLVNFDNAPTGIAPSGSDAGRDNAGSIVLTNQAIRGFRCSAPPGSFGDCDQDGRVDIMQLADGSASDCDGNGVLDRCDLFSTTICNDPSRFLCPGGVIAGLPSQVIVADNFYGYVVDTDGHTAVVGAYGDDVGGNFAGSASVFSVVGSTMQFVTTLRHANPNSMDLFGRSVAVDGAFIAVGSETRDVQGFNAAGDVSIFAKSSTGAPWQLNATLVSSNPTESGRFGASVAMQGDVIVVGSPETVVNSGAIQRGRAYVFERINSVWQFVKMLQPLDGTNQGNFGLSVAVSDGVIVIGAPYVTLEGGFETGAVYVSQRTETGWQNPVRLAGFPANAGRAGSSVAIDGTRIIVGAPGAGTQSSLSGSAVFVFEPSGSQWQLTQTIQSASPVNGGKFGARVAIDDETLLVGSWTSSDSNGSHEYFVQTGSGWETRGPIRAGFAVAVQGEYAAVGAYREARSGILVGDARMEIHLLDTDLDSKADRCERAHGDLNLDGDVGGLDLAILLAAWGAQNSNADIDLSGLVDGSDLTRLLASWGTP